MKLKRWQYLVMLAALLFGLGAVGSFSNTNTATPTVNAATKHYIKWHGKYYRSKYTLKTMRKKKHLKYKFYGYGYDNKFVGITKSAITGWYSANPASKKEVHVKHHKGTYAKFDTDPVSIGHTVHFVNLKTGHVYKYEYDEYYGN
ncbi:hypothetical protein [Lactiplantibacillus songbeiensis]|uniref:Extracellular protein n=1 Tax=Lactiplantibacillus songbeiensis TaxID=2559920 RepID=A0ABW4C3U7_9LACO|nr:hypothetical protein [Lactiplantibacillus songbeiensis]